jgi:hypothetical protein
MLRRTAGPVRVELQRFALAFRAMGAGPPRRSCAPGVPLVKPETRRNPVAVPQPDEHADWRDSSLDLLRGLDVLDLEVEDALTLGAETPHGGACVMMAPNARAGA